MAKLIFSDKLASFKKLFTGWDNNTKEEYRSIAFCQDGYIVTHGKIFRTPLGTNDNIYGLGINLTNGKLTVSAGGYTTTTDIYVLTGQGNTTYITGSDNNGTVKFTHVKPTALASSTDITKSSNGNTVSTDIDTDASIVGGITYDDYGHIHSAVTRKLILNKVKGNVSATDTPYYLLGHSANTEGTAEAYKNANVYIKNGDLYATNLYLGSTKQSITDIISASQALYFRGTIDSTLTADDADNKKFKSLPTSNVNVGDLYVVSGSYIIGSGDSAEECEAGDMIIAVKASATGVAPTWSVVQRNLVNTLTEANLATATNSGNKLHVYKDTDGKLYVDQTDTDTWRAITYGGTSLLASNSNTALNFVAGTGITIAKGTGVGDLQITNSSPLSAATGLSFKTLASTDGATAADIWTYNPNDNTAKSLTFKEGNNVSLSYANNVLTIAASYINTTYSLLAAATAAATTNADTNTTDPFVILKSNGTDTSSLQFKGAGSVAVTAKNGVITVTGTNTWRNVSAYNLSNNHAEVLASTIGTADLDFGSEFAWTKNESYGDDSNSIHLVWAEITTTGEGDSATITTTYAV